MRIAFFGDSITEGIPGVSYVDIISENNLEFDVVNLGKGGDTVSSLKRRVKKMSDLATFDMFVLFIGINDIYGNLSWQYKLLKALRRQTAARNLDSFENEYIDLLSILSVFNKKIIVIPPLLLGENIANNWNKQVTELDTIISKLVKKFDAIYLNVREIFIKTLEDKEISEYLPLKVVNVIKDVSELKNSYMVDQRSLERGLHLTLDGVHINSRGAKIISDKIMSELVK